MSNSVPESRPSDSKNFESSQLHENAERKPRGPLRPDAWINTRQREALRLRVFLYRGIDVALATGLSLLCLIQFTSGDTITQVTIGQALPYVLGLFCILSLSRSLELYSFNRTRSVIHHSAMIIGSVMIGTLPALLIQYVLKSGTILNVMVWGFLMAFLLGGLHIIWSSLINAGRFSGALIPNIVLIGANSEAEFLVRRAREKRDMNIIAVFDDRLSRAPETICGVPVIGHIDDLLQSRLTPYIDTIAVMIEPEAYNRVRHINQKLLSLPNHVTVFMQEAPRECYMPNRAIQRLASTPVAILSGAQNNKDRNAFLKRLTDCTLSATALAILAPALVVIGVLIRLDSPGPALFRQKRHGFNHETITVRKFRTMRHDIADANASLQVTKGDDRITRIGRFLRRTSIDELPQLLNVLTGEMSLVGPRPHAIGMKTGVLESATIVADYAHRHRIKPGLTGWAAVNGSRGPLHSAADVRKRVQLDIEYIEHQNFWFDISIILRTIPVLLGDRLAIR